jgi:hypothetical protein
MMLEISQKSIVNISFTMDKHVGKHSLFVFPNERLSNFIEIAT